MTAQAIDLDMLDKLFDNQKNLDDIFSSIFDEDPVQYTPQLSNEPIFDSGSWEDNQDLSFNDNISVNADVRKKSSVAYVVIPVVLEIAVICYGISYFF